MAEPVHDGKRPAATPVAAGADSLLSSGSAPQQLQDLLGNAASRFPNVEIPTVSCAEQGQEIAEESPLQITSAGTVAADGTSWTDGADSMEPGCWGWNEEHANGSDNAEGKMRAHAGCAPRHGFSIGFSRCADGCFARADNDCDSSSEFMQLPTSPGRLSPKMGRKALH
jgi:hypothetical protein